MTVRNCDIFYSVILDSRSLSKKKGGEASEKLSRVDSLDTLSVDIYSKWLPFFFKFSHVKFLDNWVENFDKTTLFFMVNEMQISGFCLFGENLKWHLFLGTRKFIKITMSKLL